MSKQGNRIGLPPEILWDQPAETLHVRIGEMVKTRSGKGMKPQALGYFKVIKVDDTGADLGEHPDYKGTHLKSIPIVLTSDDPVENFKAGISAWDGMKGPFCYNRWGANTAMRRQKNGEFLACPCDRTKCPMWLNKKGDSAKIKASLDAGEPPLYEQFANGTVNQNRKAGEFAALHPHGRITRDLKCSAEMYFFFEVDGITKAGEVARVYTQSENTIRQLLSSMTRLLRRTGGVLAGVPLELFITTKRSSHSKERVPVLGVRARTADGEEFRRQVLDVQERMQLTGINWENVRGILAQKTMMELAGEGGEHIATHFMEGEQRDAAMKVLPKDKEEIAAEGKLVDYEELEQNPGEFVNVMDDPDVAELAGRLEFNQAEKDSIAMQSRGDIEKAKTYLLGLCQKRKVDVGDYVTPEPEATPPPEDDPEPTEAKESILDNVEVSTAPGDNPVGAMIEAAAQETLQPPEPAPEPDSPLEVVPEPAATPEPAPAPVEESKPEPKPSPVADKVAAAVAAATVKPAKGGLPDVLKRHQQPATEESPELGDNPPAAPPPASEKPTGVKYDEENPAQRNIEDLDLTDLGPPLDMSDNPLDGAGGKGDFKF